MKRTGALTLALIALAAVPSVASAAAPAARAAAPGSAAAIADYWTPERMRSAKPLELMERGGDGHIRPRSHPIPYTSLPVANPTVFPLPQNGKLFGEIKQVGRFECSATVAQSFDHRVVFTAGHCVFDPESGQFAKRLMFVPAYIDGAAPYGKWPWTQFETTRQWVRQNNANFDYAAIELSRARSGAAIEEVVGGRPVLASAPRHQPYVVYGYPGNIADAQLMWSCTSHYGGDDPRPQRGGKPPMAVGCNMGPGASGGGWITATGGLASLSSFAYRKHPDVLYGPYLTAKATRLVARLGAP